MPRPLRPKLGLALVVVLLAGLVAAGCGSDNKSSSSATTPAITKASFVAKGNAICTAGNKVINAANAKLTKNSTKAQFLAVVKGVDIPNIQAQIKAIQALGIPTGDEATVKNFLSLAQADLDKVKANPMLLGGSTDAFADFAKVAHPYGLTECDKPA